MYGKLMSISDTLMVELLDPAHRPEAERGRCAEGRGGERRRTPNGGEEAAGADNRGRLPWRGSGAEGDENWAKQFQRDEAPGDLDEVAVSAAEAGWTAETGAIRLDKLLVRLGLAESAAMPAAR